MKQIKGWWFGTTDKKLKNNDGRRIIIGKTHRVSGDIIPCEHGLHLSRRIIDALNYAPGPVIYRVVGSGIIVPHGDPVDKFACSERTYVAGGIDISDTLRSFSRKCALDAIHLWDAPKIVVRYLKTGDESIRAAASAAASDAARAAWAAWTAASASAAAYAAWAAASAAYAAWAACDAASDAARAASDAAWAAARAAASDAACDAACDAAWAAQNAHLTRMVNKLIQG